MGSPSRSRKCCRDDCMARDLIASSVEKILLTAGVDTCDRVLGAMYGRYRCTLESCYDNPEYLCRTLEGMFPAGAGYVLELVARDLAGNCHVEKFLGKIRMRSRENGINVF